MNMRTASGSGQRGVALVIVLLLLTVMTGLGFMALLTANIEMDLTRSYRNRQFLKAATEAGGHSVVRQIIKSRGTDKRSIPRTDTPTGNNPNERRTHPVIGICQVTQFNCGQPLSAVYSDTNLCCFRTGKITDSTGNILKMTDSNIGADQASPFTPSNVDIPGSSSYQHIDYEVSVSAGVPSRGISELVVRVRSGPVPKSDGGGYGDDGTGISRN